MRNVLDANRQRPFYYSINTLTTRDKLARYIEDSMASDAKERYVAPGDYEGIIFIDDIHLSSVEYRPWSLIKSFYDHRGWYSMEKNTFIWLDNMAMIGVSSHNFASGENVFDDSFSNIPRMFLMKMNIMMIPEMEPKELKSIFNAYTEDLLEDLNPSNYDILNRFIKQYTAFYYRNKTNLQVISQIFGCNFSVSITAQFFRNLELWDWEKDVTDQKTIDIWFYNIKRSYGTQFSYLNKLPAEYILTLENQPTLILEELNQKFTTTSSDSESDNSNLDENGEKFERKPHRMKSSLFTDPRKDIRDRSARGGILLDSSG